MDADMLDDPRFQAMIVDAVKVIDMVAQASDDNRAEIPFKRKDGAEMIITIQEQNQ